MSLKARNTNIAPDALNALVKMKDPSAGDAPADRRARHVRSVVKLNVRLPHALEQRFEVWFMNQREFTSRNAAMCAFIEKALDERKD